MGAAWASIFGPLAPKAACSALRSVLASAQIVRMPGLQARPLGGGTSIGTGNLLALKPLWPAGRRVLPRLLPPVDGHVEQPVAVIHRLDAAYRRPVSLEDIGSFSEVANDVHHAHPASNQEGVERALGRVPRHLPTHEVAVPGALFVRALAKRGVGDVARMNIGQLADLRCNPGAPLALLRRRVAGLPHEVVAMSIRRPSNTSNTVTAPRSPMSDVAPSTSTIGSRRRAAAMASPSLV